MEINPVEIQNLLLNLVDVLAPIAQEAKPKDTRFLAKRIFDPSQRTPPNKEARLLTTLQTAHKQMVKWIQSDVKTEGRAKEVKTSQAKSSFDFSLANQARSLLFQVRSVINTLSTSSRLGKLEESVVDDETIAKLKSLVEELIDTVERKETDFSGNRAPPTPLRPLPKSHREYLKKSVPLPSFPTTGREEKKPLPKASRSTEKSSPFQKASPYKEPTKIKEELLLKPLIKPEGDQSKPPPSAERTSLPGAPYLPEKNLFSKLLKKKKKKKQSNDDKEEKSR